MHLGACCFRALYIDLRSLPMHRLLGQPKQQQKLPGFFIATAAHDAPPKWEKPVVQSDITMQTSQSFTCQFILQIESKMLGIKQEETLKNSKVLLLC